MNDLDLLRCEYEAALESYLANRSEAALARSSVLGKQALKSSAGMLDLVTVHHESLSRLAGGDRTNEGTSADIEAAGEFFREAMSAFEMSQRDFVDLRDKVAQMVHFMSVVCHELRTPMTSLVTSVGMLGEVINPIPGGFEARILANIDRSADILRSRTDDLLDFAGFQAGTLELKPTRVEVASLFASVMKTMAPQLESAAVEAHCEVADALPPIVADEGRIEQILFNLIENAIKYGADGGKIDLRSYRNKGDLVIEVQDYGSGVSLWDQMHIFQPNYRSKRAAGEVPGLGIGLALCKELVSQHRGTLTLESREGEGSLFRVTLPISRETGAEGQRCESGSDRRRAGSC